MPNPTNNDSPEIDIKANGELENEADWRAKHPSTSADGYKHKHQQGSESTKLDDLLLNAYYRGKDGKGYSEYELKQDTAKLLEWSRQEAVRLMETLIKNHEQSVRTGKLGTVATFDGAVLTRDIKNFTAALQPPQEKTE